MIAACAVSMCLVSCSSDDATDEAQTNEKISLTIGAGADIAKSGELTRAYVADPKADPNVAIMWELGDKISLFSQANNSNSQFEATEVTTNKAKFTGTTTKADNYYFLYPYQSDAALVKIDGKYYIKATIPADQPATPGTFYPKAMLQTGTISGADPTSVNLKNTCAFLYITVPAGVASVDVTSDGSYGLAGTMYIEPASNGSVIKSDGWTSRSTTATISGIGGKAGTYVLCVAPSTTYPTLTVTVNGVNGTKKTATKTGTISINAGFFYSLGDLSELSF